MFDRAYYDTIWGSVHRHDYCADLAAALIRRYGAGRLLDIGSGCGFLIKTLRKLGCESWGIEISEHAMANRCSDYLIRGSVLAIPFPDNYFATVHSQGLWEYIAEVDIQQAWAECKRVGIQQLHNYDTLESTIFPEHQFITVKPRAWWEARLS